jgi:NADH-quinone oxidoreductase subunit A
MPVRFYLVAVLFIIFDIEVVFILPWAVVLNEFIGMGLGFFTLIVMTIFIVVLLVGFVYEWKMGAMEWE